MKISYAMIGLLKDCRMTQKAASNKITELELALDDQRQEREGDFKSSLVDALQLDDDVADIGEQRAAGSGDLHHVKLTSLHHPYSRGPDDWTKEDGDGRKTCCSIFYNANPARLKCKNVAHHFCVECTYTQGETYYLCSGCFSARGTEEDPTMSLHQEFPPRNFFDEVRYSK